MKRTKTSLTSRLVIISAMMAGVFGLAVFLIWPRQDGATEFRSGDIAVIEPWARATPGPSRIGAVYLTIANRGGQPDRLIGADTAIAQRVEVHNTITENGMMQMRPLESVELAPGQTVQFAPNGMHLMLMGLKEPLVEGRTFELDFVFEVSGARKVKVVVRKS